MGKPLGECHEMYRMLSEYAQLGETTRRGGVTVCPPAMARGIGLSRLSAGGRDDSGNVRQEDVRNTPERRLAISKLVVMLQDLSGKPAAHDSSNNQMILVDKARHFFFDRSDLEFWCLLAGYDVEKVRQKAKGIVEGTSSGSASGGRRRPWSEQDIEFLIAQRSDGTNFEEIAYKLGRNRESVRVMHSKMFPGQKKRR